MKKQLNMNRCLLFFALAIICIKSLVAVVCVDDLFSYGILSVAADLGVKNYFYFCYIAVSCMIAFISALLCYRKKIFFSAFNHNRYVALWWIMIFVAFATSPANSALVISQLLIFILLCEVLKNTTCSISSKNGIYIFLGVNLLIIFLLYHQRPTLVPPEPDDAFIYQYAAARVANGLDDSTVAMNALRKDIPEQKHYEIENYDFRHEHNYVDFRIDPTFGWAFFISCLMSYFSLSPNFAFLLSLIIGFMLIGGSCFVLYSMLVNGKISLRNAGILFAMTALLSFASNPVQFTYFRNEVYGQSLLILILVAIYANKSRYLIILAPLLMVVYPLHLYCIPICIAILFLILLHKFTKYSILDHSISMKTLFACITIFTGFYLCYFCLEYCGYIQYRFMYGPSDIFVFTSDASSEGLHLWQVIYRQLSLFPKLFYRSFFRLTLGLNPIYLLVWFLSLQYLFRNGSHRQFVANYRIGYIALVLMTVSAMFVSGLAVQKFLYIMQILNYGILIYFITSDRNRNLRIPVIIAIAVVALFPKFSLARHWGKINNFRNPFPVTLSSKLSPRSVIFHGDFRNGMAEFLSYPENYRWRNAFIYQWLNEDLELDGYDIDKSYIIAFDKNDLFQKTLLKYLNNNIMEISYIEKKKMDEQKGLAMVINSCSFSLRGKKYTIDLIEAAWPFLLYKINEENISIKKNTHRNSKR